MRAVASGDAPRRSPPRRRNGARTASANAVVERRAHRSSRRAPRRGTRWERRVADRSARGGWNPPSVRGWRRTRCWGSRTGPMRADVILAGGCTSTSTPSPLDDSPVYYRSAEAADGRAAALPPRSSHELGRLDRVPGSTGGLAPDLIGFGRSGKGEHLDFRSTACPISSRTSSIRSRAWTRCRSSATTGAPPWPEVRPSLSRAGHEARALIAIPPVEGFAWPRFVRPVADPRRGRDA